MDGQSRLEGDRFFVSVLTGDVPFRVPPLVNLLGHCETPPTTKSPLRVGLPQAPRPAPARANSSDQHKELQERGKGTNGCGEKRRPEGRGKRVNERR